MPKGFSKEILVVDDGGKDETRQRLRGIKGARYIWQDHAGPAAARNRGAKEARGEILAFLDSDTQAAPGWLEAGTRRLAADSALFGVEGKVLPESEGPASPFSEQVENRKGGRWLTCNLFVRRAAFLELGGFDERFKRPVREDSEFAFRALEAGKIFAFEERALVRHPVRAIGASRYFFHAQEGQYESLLRSLHPRSYRLYFKWWDGRAFPAYYAPHFAALFLACIDWRLALLSWGLGTLLVLYAWCRKRQIRASDPWRLLLPALFVPWCRLLWVTKGYLAYPHAPE
jgi:glycosyltransferase involved in cell wall biosynthesis